jgi:hypothetical protein
VFATTGEYVTGVVSASGNVTGGNLLTGGLISATGALTVTGSTFLANVSAGNIDAGTVYSGGNITTNGQISAAGNIITNGQISAVGNVTAASGLFTNIVNVASVTGAVVSVSGNITGGNGMFTTIVNTASHTGAVVSVSGNVTGNYFVGNGSLLTGISGGGGGGANIANGTSNITIASSGGNATVNIGGTANVAVFATTGEFVTGVISATGNITGGNVNTGGLISATGNITGGNVTTAGVLTVNSGAAATAIVNGAGNAVGNIGSSGTYFNRLFAQATTALYADLAEVYKADAEYPPGTVLVFGGDQEVTISNSSHDARIAGVVSTNPAHVMNSGLVSEFTVEVGLIGRVPCQVIGSVAVGDRVVSSNRAGVAERLDMQHYQPGVIIGKAVESYNGIGVGTIEVVVGRL